MKLNEKKFFALAKDAGLESADLTSNETSSLSVSVFHGEVDSLTNNSSYELVARGIYKGKMGTISVDNVNKDSPEYLVKEIKRGASIIENDDPVFVFKGSEKYHKKNVSKNVDFGENVQEKVGILLEIEKKLLAYDKRINEVVTVGFESSSHVYKKTNSYGLKLSQKMNMRQCLILYFLFFCFFLLFNFFYLYRNNSSIYQFGKTNGIDFFIKYSHFV